MMTSGTSPSLAGSLVAVAIVCLPPSTSASTIIFANSGDPTAVPVVAPLSVDLTSDVVLSDQGDFSATCRKAAPGDPYCAGVSATAPPIGAPVLTFTASRTTVDLQSSNRSVTLSWTNTPAAAVCLASGNTPASSHWAGTRPSSGPQVITYTAVGTYQYTLSCYNDAGKSEAITRTVVVSNGGTPVSGCNVVKSQIADPVQRALFQPEGFNRETRTWPQVFGANMVFPNTPSDFYPVGSWTLSGLVYAPAVGTRGKYLSIPIVGNGNTLQLQWNSAKPVAAFGYQPARFASSVYVTISTCEGDFRRAGAFQYTSPDPAGDPNFVTQCRSTNTSEAVMSYGPSAAGALFCPVEQGREYFINIVIENVLDGLDPNTSGCSTSATGVCEISVKNRPTL